MSDAGTIILQYVCPAVGVVLATQMFLAPYRDVTNAIARGSLGELNPLPWVFMLGNCAGWILYSFLTKDFFLYAGNITGLLLSIWFNLSASNLLFKQQVAQLPDFIRVVDTEEHSDTTANAASLNALSAIDEGDEEKGTGRGSGTGSGIGIGIGIGMPENTNDPGVVEKGNTGPPPITELPVFYTAPIHDYRVMAMSVLWMIVFSVVGFADSLSADTKRLLVGSVTNFCLVFFYGAPLSCIAVVLKTHNTATLHVPTMFTNTASSVFWGVYGFAIMDFFVAVPNLIGALLGAVQIVLYMIYPRVETTSVPVITAAIPAPNGGGDNTNPDGTMQMEIVQLQLHNMAADDLLGHSNMLGNTNAGDASNNPMNVAYGFPSPSKNNNDADADDDANNNNNNNNHDSSRTVTFLQKQEITMDGVTAASTENPLIIQYYQEQPIIESSELPPGSGSLEGPVPPANVGGRHVGTLHRRTASASSPSSPSLHRRTASASSSSSSHAAGAGHSSEGGPPAAEASSSSDAINHNNDYSGLYYSASTNPTTSAAVASVHHRRVLSNNNPSFLAGLFAREADILNVETTTTATLHRRVLSAPFHQNNYGSIIPDNEEEDEEENHV